MAKITFDLDQIDSDEWRRAGLVETMTLLSERALKVMRHFETAGMDPRRFELFRFELHGHHNGAYFTGKVVMSPTVLRTRQPGNEGPKDSSKMEIDLQMWVPIKDRVKPWDSDAGILEIFRERIQSNLSSYYSDVKSAAELQLKTLA